MFRKIQVDDYCYYSMEQEPENCFVAVNDGDNVKRYMNYAVNFDTYAREFRKKYLKTLNPVTKMQVGIIISGE